jgi:hypothetical protein
MNMPGFAAEASLYKMTSHHEVTRYFPALESAVYPAQVSTIPGESINPLSWYAVHSFFPEPVVVHPGQVAAFGACLKSCVAATKDYAACQRGCCLTFTHHNACVLP